MFHSLVVDGSMASEKSFSVSEKLEMLQKYDEYHKTVPPEELVTMCGIPYSILLDLVKNRDKIVQEANNRKTQFKKMKQGRYKKLDKILTQWFLAARASAIPVDRTDIRTKAKEIAKNLGIDTFNASNEWISRFKERYDLTKSGDRAKKNYAEVDLSAWRHQVLPNLLDEYEPENVFNAAELGLFFKAGPTQGLMLQNRTCPGGELATERLTVLLCSNSDGSEKLQPVVIGKSEHPTSIENINVFRCTYVNHKHAWMTYELFTNWVKALDEEMSRKKRKILLFVDDSPAHPKVLSFDNIKIVVLPANSPNVLLPMDQGITRCFKRNYKSNLILRLSQSEHSTLNVLDAMTFIKSAWNEVPSQTIANCFKKVSFRKTTPSDITALGRDLASDTPLEQFMTVNEKMKFQEYVIIDSNLICCQEQQFGNTEDINDQCEDVDKDSSTGQSDIPSFNETIQAIDTLRRHLHSIPNSEHISTLYRIENEVILNNENFIRSKIKQLFF